MHRLTPAGDLELKGLPGRVIAWHVGWDAEQDFALCVALADDSVLLRQGIAQVLERDGIDVALQVSDAEALMRGLAAARPHVVVIDVRMPPTHTTEGLDAAERIRAEHPEIGVLVLSTSVNPAAARRLLENASGGVGYLLKERVADIDELTTAIRTVASGGSAIDPEVIARLATCPRARSCAGGNTHGHARRYARTASTRRWSSGISWRSSLRKIVRTWLSIVRGLRTSCSQIHAFDRP
jgi:DNA-binding NarL/FixJ family response regulator